MATSKIKAIEKTLRKAIDYIINPDKTDGGQLVYSHGCSVGTADLEMNLTAKQGTKRGDRIAYHLMQAFSPDDDITPEKALQLGIEFAQKVTGGNYEFVIATHVDKEHIHNHIIFNSVDYVKHRKYHSDTKDKYRIRDINDEICKANDLSVLPKYDAKRKKKYENVHKKGTEIWRDKLRKAIDQAIQNAETFEDMLFALEMEGYEIKREGKMGELKYMSFRAPGQEKFIRATRSLGDRYTKEAIIERIANKDKEAVLQTEPEKEKPVVDKKQNAAKVQSTGMAVPVQKQKEAQPRKRPFPSKRINLLVDISKNVKAQQSKGYEQALVRSNINMLVKTMNFLIQHKITTPEDFQIYAEGKKAEYLLYRKDSRKLEMELLELSEKIKFTQNYKKNAAVYYESRRVKDPAAFAREHEDELVLFKASEMYFTRNGLNPKELNLTEMFERYKALKAEKGELAKRSNAVKKEIDELDRAAQNIETALGISLEEPDKSQNGGRERDEHSAEH